MRYVNANVQHPTGWRNDAAHYWAAPMDWNWTGCSMSVGYGDLDQIITWLRSVVVVCDGFAAEMGRRGGAFDLELAPYGRFDERVARKGGVSLFWAALVTIDPQTATCWVKQMNNAAKRNRGSAVAVLLPGSQAAKTANHRKVQQFCRILILEMTSAPRRQK